MSPVTTSGGDVLLRHPTLGIRKPFTIRFSSIVAVIASLGVQFDRGWKSIHLFRPREGCITKSLFMSKQEALPPEVKVSAY